MYTYVITYIYIYILGVHHVPVMIYTNSSPLGSKIPPKSLFLIDAKLILKERHLDPPKNQMSSHLGELYPLVNVYKKLMGKIHHAIFMGKSTISTGLCSIAMLNYQRVIFHEPEMLGHFGMIPLINHDSRLRSQ